MRTGTVYTETVIHSAPEKFVSEVPYQVAIVSLDEGGRVTARIDGERVAIGDKLVETEGRDGMHVFRKA